MYISKVKFQISLSVLMILAAGGCQVPEPGQEPTAAAPAETAAEAPAAEKKMKAAPELAFRFVPGRTDRYRLETRSVKSVQWTGAVPKDAGFQGGRNERVEEVVFSRTITALKNGGAVADVRIEAIKLSTVVRDKVLVDFDSSKASGEEAMASLIGASYSIEIAPTGEVAAVSGADAARAGIKGDSAAAKGALSFLTDDTIKARHGTFGLAQDSRGELLPGLSWSDEKKFSFGLMGSKTYKRVFRVREIDHSAGAVVAVVEMNGEQMQIEPAADDPAREIARKFDSSGTYVGLLRFDASNGRLESYSEEVELSWVMLESPAEEGAEPAMLEMAATRVYEIERLKD